MSELRFDRLLTLGLARPLHSVISGGESCLPILMYHGISQETENGPAYYRTTTSPGVFAEQMSLLLSIGWRAVNMRRGHELLREGKNLSKTVVVTFDDGFRDFYTQAMPILTRHGFSATMYLPTGFIGDGDTRQFKGRECLNWTEVRELQQAGIELGSHTVSHPRLYELDFPQIRIELEVSKAVIEEKLGERITSFAYPYAFPSSDKMFVEKFTDALQNAGYENNVTTRIGRARSSDNVFTLKRLPVNSGDDRSLLLAKLSGAYDWMNWPQGMVKKIKSLVLPSGSSRVGTPLSSENKFPTS